MKYTICLLLCTTACHSQLSVASATPMAPAQINVIVVEEPDISFTATHDLSDDEARVAAQSLASSLEKYGIKWSWQNNTINFEATSGVLNGVYGTLILKHPHVTVDIYNIPEFIPDSIVTQRVNGRIQVYFNID